MHPMTRKIKIPTIIMEMIRIIQTKIITIVTVLVTTVLVTTVLVTTVLVTTVPVMMKITMITTLTILTTITIITTIIIIIIIKIRKITKTIIKIKNKTITMKQKAMKKALMFPVTLAIKYPTHPVIQLLYPP